MSTTTIITSKLSKSSITFYVLKYLSSRNILKNACIKLQIFLSKNVM